MSQQQFYVILFGPFSDIVKVKEVRARNELEVHELIYNHSQMSGKLLILNTAKLISLKEALGNVI